MIIDPQLDMFQAQAEWLEAEYKKECAARKPNWKKLVEILTRIRQLNTEFTNFVSRST